MWYQKTLLSVHFTRQLLDSILTNYQQLMVIWKKQFVVVLQYNFNCLTKTLNFSIYYVEEASVQIFFFLYNGEQLSVIVLFLYSFFFFFYFCYLSCCDFNNSIIYFFFITDTDSFIFYRRNKNKNALDAPTSIHARPNLPECFSAH